ncbi:TVP38/TMEM64 family protein [Cytobacillus solani]|uniref:TVP38/TMEM64 family protein n=1 Tax=Cytobacillus solani TaxID=1637975 RepID=UPI0006AB914F|nr:VTT domain-containing protein [Cytobacillus solani]USK53302.1 VTT domain-containing protein [Cytobacillus solani]
MYKIIILLTVLIVAIYFLFHSNLYHVLKSGEIETITTFLGENLYYTLGITFIIMIIQNSFTIIPLILVISLNIALYGLYYGFLWSWITSIISSIFVFLGIRFGFQDWILKKLKPELVNLGEKHGFLYVLQARVIPFIPTSIINITAGLSPIRLKEFITATSIGNFIYFIILSLIPAGLFSGKINEYVLGILAFFFILLFYLIKKFYHKNNRNTAGEKQE